MLKKSTIAGFIAIAAGGLALFGIGGSLLMTQIDIRNRTERIRREVPWLIVASSCAKADNMQFLWALSAYTDNEGQSQLNTWQEIRDNYPLYERRAGDAISNYTNCKLKRFRVSSYSPSSSYFTPLN